MVHHYAYMINVASVREPESFMEASKDARWLEAMEEDTGDLVQPPRECKLIGSK